MSTPAKVWLNRIRALPLQGKFKIMNVCGGHERALTMAGLRAVLPENLELIPGSGCPVCVCPEEDVHQAIQLALRETITLVAFGDMLRVPANVPKGEIRSLDQARAAGADIRPIASPREAAAIARAQPGRPLVFFASGFETTATRKSCAPAIPGPPGCLASARRRNTPRLRLRQRGAGPALPQPVPAVRPRLHAALAGRPLHGFRRRRLPHLVGRRRKKRSRHRIVRNLRWSCAHYGILIPPETARGISFNPLFHHDIPADSQRPLVLRLENRPCGKETFSAFR